MSWVQARIPLPRASYVFPTCPQPVGIHQLIQLLFQITFWLQESFNPELAKRAKNCIDALYQLRYLFLKTRRVRIDSAKDFHLTDLLMKQFFSLYHEEFPVGNY